MKKSLAPLADMMQEVCGFMGAGSKKKALAIQYGKWKDVWRRKSYAFIKILRIEEKI